MTNRAMVAGLLLVLAWNGVASEETPEAKEKRLKVVAAWKETLAGLKNPKVEVFRVKPLDQTMIADKDDETMVYGWPILERKTAAKAEDIAAITQALTDPDSYSNIGAKCFDPGLAFRFSAQGKSIAFVICLECKWVYEMDGKTMETVAISKVGDGALLKLYTQYFGEPRKADAEKR